MFESLTTKRTAKVKPAVLRFGADLKDRASAEKEEEHREFVAHPEQIDDE